MTIPEITVDALAELLDADVRLIDVREPDEYAEAHVPGAILVSLGTVPDNIDAFSGDDPTYVICKSGGRSLKACEYVSASGANVVNVAGGTMAWQLSGRECANGGA